MIIGLLITISNLVEQKAGFWGCILGLVVGGLTSLVMFSAVLGVTP